MRFIAPRTGAPEATFGEEQQEYIPVTAAVYFHPGQWYHTLLFRLRLSNDERQRLIAGEDIYLRQLQAGNGMTPMNVFVGLPEEFVWREPDPNATVPMPIEPPSMVTDDAPFVPPTENTFEAPAEYKPETTEFDPNGESQQ